MGMLLNLGKKESTAPPFATDEEREKDPGIKVRWSVCVCLGCVCVGGRAASVGFGYRPAGDAAMSAHGPLPNLTNTNNPPKKSGESLGVEVASALALQRRLLQPQDGQLRAAQRGAYLIDCVYVFLFPSCTVEASDPFTCHQC